MSRNVLVALLAAVIFMAASAPSPMEARARPRRTFVDVNTADSAALAAIPGIGPRTARAILEDRDRQGPFRRPSDLMRVPGMGPVKAPRVARYLVFPETGPDGSLEDLAGPRSRPTQPMDLNLATPDELVHLPGLDWALAYRIASERDKGGPYRTLDDLLSVRGITERHLVAWRPWLFVGGPPLLR